MSKIFVKPARVGLIVRHPEKINYILPADGEWVENSTQWQRYLRDGDVVLAEPAVTTVKADKKTAVKDKV